MDGPVEISIKYGHKPNNPAITLGGKETNKMTQEISAWKGSSRTAALVASEIAARWGKEEVKNYNPDLNCFTLRRWNQDGYRVKKGEKAIKSVTFVPVLGTEPIAEGTKEVKCYSVPKTVNLFYILQTGGNHDNK